MSAIPRILHRDAAVNFSLNFSLPLFPCAFACVCACVCGVCVCVRACVVRHSTLSLSNTPGVAGVLASSNLSALLAEMRVVTDLLFNNSYQQRTPTLHILALFASCLHFASFIALRIWIAATLTIDLHYQQQRCWPYRLPPSTTLNAPDVLFQVRACVQYPFCLQHSARQSRCLHHQP